MQQLKEPLHAHLPLWALAGCFPEHFRLVREYESLAVVRDPLERFCSALMLHSREFLCQSSSEISGDSLSETARKLISRIPDVLQTLDASLVHFIPQLDFVNYQGERVVKYIDVPGQFVHLNRFFLEHGLNPVKEESRVNASVQPKNPLVAHVL